MSTFDQNDFENSIDVPPLEDTDSLPKIVQQISVVSDAIEKCEKILQHIAVGNFSDEFQRYMSMHVHLISQRNSLIKKIEELKAIENKSSEKLTEANHKKRKLEHVKSWKWIIAISAEVILVIIIIIIIFAWK